MRAADHIVDLGPGAGEHGGHVVAEGTAGAGASGSRESLTGQYLARHARQIAVPAKRRKPEGRHRGPRRRAAQPEEDRRRVPARRVLLRHGRVRVGQVDARERDPLPRGREPAAPREAAPRRRTTHGSRASTRSTRSSTSTSRRSGARRARTRPPTPACSTTSASSTRARPRRGRAATSRAASRSTSRAAAARSAAATGRSRSRCTSCRTSTCPCEQCHGKRYNRETLDIRFKGKTIADVLEMSVEEALEFFSNIPKVKRRLQTLHDVGPRLHPARPAGDDAVRRRGAAREARLRAVSKVATGCDAVHPRRADDRPPLRRRAAAARRARPARRRGQHGGRDRAQPRRDQDRRLDHRPRPGGRRRAAASWSPPARPSRSPRVEGSYTGRVPAPRSSTPAAPAPDAAPRGSSRLGRACHRSAATARFAELALVAIAAVWGLTFVMVQDAIERAAADGFPGLSVHPGRR